MEKQNEADIVREEVNRMVVWAQNLVVASVEDYKIAFASIAEIKGIRKRWSDWWLPLRNKTYAAYKEVLAKLQEGTKTCDKAEKIAKDKADSWRYEQELKAQEQQRKLQSIADEKARRERDRLEKEAAKLKTPEKKAERLEQAAEVITPIITVAKPVDLEGVSVRTTTKARLVNLATLIAAATPGSVAASFLEFNERAANAFARSTKGKVLIPGIEFYQERSSAVNIKEG